MLQARISPGAHRRSNAARDANWSALAGAGREHAGSATRKTAAQRNTKAMLPRATRPRKLQASRASDMLAPE